MAMTHLDPGSEAYRDHQIAMGHGPYMGGGGGVEYADPNTDCARCDGGVVAREVDDYDPDFGVTYKAIGGCAFDAATRDWLCPACARDTSSLTAALDHGDA